MKKFLFILPLLAIGCSLDGEVVTTQEVTVIESGAFFETSIKIKDGACRVELECLGHDGDFWTCEGTEKCFE